MDLTKHYTIALDVGRTFIRSALVDDNGHILPESFSIFSSKFSQSEILILKNIVKIIKFNLNSILYPDFEIQHIVFSLPDNYIGKKGQCFLNEKGLSNLLYEDSSIASKLSTTCAYYFEQESYLFGLGEYILRDPYDRNKKILYVLLGSDMSYTILENTIRVDEYEDTMISKEHLSGAAITELGKELGLVEPYLNPKEIAEMSLKNDERAIKTYEEFGRQLGQYLDSIIYKHSPSEIIIGGNIALSYPVFEKSLLKELNEKVLTIYPTEHTSYYIFFGITEYIKHNINNF